MDTIVNFARTFPTLADAPLRPWDALAFDKWAADPARPTAARHAAACVLAVWSGPGAPADRLRKDLCAELLRLADDCDYRLEAKALRYDSDSPDAGERAIRGLCLRAREVVREAVAVFSRGDLREARRLVESLDDLAECRAFHDWITLERRSINLDEVLRRLAHAETWRVGSFNAPAALHTWDVHHRDAFLAWARSPWWC